ncbi:MAG: transcription-repair coupling factor [Bacteroidales bacterium]|nr:transcription-repair coupling factor [Bacteroidales bacterium]
MSVEFRKAIAEELSFYPPLLKNLEAVMAQKEGLLRVKLTGLAGSSLALSASILLKQSNEHQLFVFPDRESAAFFFHDLEVLWQENQIDEVQKRVHYFPASYRRTRQYEEIDSVGVTLRTELMNRLLHSHQKLVVVTYPDALLEKVVTTQYLQENSFSLTKGKDLVIDNLLHFLYDNKYLQADFVYEPGQFSWRGGVFDLYPYGESAPLRIELSGDEIESLRIFDETTQLSVYEKDNFQIMPYISDEKNAEKRINFIQFLGGKPTLWLSNIADIKNIIADNYKKIEEALENAEHHYLSGEEFLHTILDYALVEIHSDLLQKYHLHLDFGIKPQNHFAKKFEFLLQEWVDNHEHGIRNFFLSENENQIERVEHIMADLLLKYNEENHTHYEVDQSKDAEHGICTFKILELHEGFRDEQGKLACYTDHQFFDKYHRFSIRDKAKKAATFSLKEIFDLHPGDYVVHIDHGIGVYQGLQKMEINGKEQEVIRLSYKDGDTLYISIHSLHKISKYVGKEGTAPTLHRIGSGSWEKLKERTKTKVKELAIDLIKLYAQRKSEKGFAYSADNYLQNELEASFIYEDTPDQTQSLKDVKNDMESEHPMDRLICGDVGFGKTEIAIRAAFKAVCDSKQVAVLVPTTVLALQHFTTFSERLADFPVKVDYVNRFKSAKQIKESLEKLQTGGIDILIGTHRLLSKDVKFKDLGLLIIDEEQKFGVAAKEKLREMKAIVDTLTLSATPIPRTLQFSLMGARDISVIATPPPNRYPIQTEIHVFDEKVIKEAVSYEISRGGQLFFVHNKIENINEIAALIQRLVPEARIAVGHGQMEGAKLEQIMFDFISGKQDVLVSTTIVESGLDISNANTMIINDAQNFALNVLHQLRGRVGRNNKKAFCYMMIRSFEELNDQARKRLKAIEEYSDIGSGFQIAMRDLDIRGAGDILGGEQSGFVNEMGFDMYQKILNEAIIELRESGDMNMSMAENAALLQKECVIETDLGLLLPTDYVSSVNERMNLYKELDAISDEKELAKFCSKLTDLFGPIPPQTRELVLMVMLRQKALSFYIEKIVLKNNQLTGYFTNKMDSPFYQSDQFGHILSFMQAHYPQVQIKEANGKAQLIIKNVKSVKEAIGWLEKMG